MFFTKRHWCFSARICCTYSSWYATAVSEYLGVFDLVIASHESRNLYTKHEADMLVERFGERRFDSAGNEDCDLKAWERAPHGW
jgi:hypothetical protein